MGWESEIVGSSEWRHREHVRRVQVGVLPVRVISQHRRAMRAGGGLNDEIREKSNRKGYSTVCVQLLRSWPDKGLRFYAQGLSRRALDRSAAKFTRQLDRARFIAKETRDAKSREFQELHKKAEFDIVLYTALLFDARDMPKDFLFWAQCCVEYTPTGTPVLVPRKSQTCID